MPELPEVEHQARFLRRLVLNRKITRAEASPTQVLQGKTTSVSFTEALSGRHVSAIERVGKFLILRLDSSFVLLSHLGMTGRWVARSSTDPSPSHTRASLFLEEERVFRYVDRRMLGRLEILHEADLAKHKSLASLGPDPLLDGLDAARLATLLATTRRPIKAVLMDAKIIAGIGNIQATEALFRARVHPQRPASSLSKDEITAIADGIVATIAHTLAAHAHEDEIVYLSDRRDVKNPFLVYGRVNEACSRCRTLISTVVVAMRSSAFCPSCQPATRAATRSALQRGR